MSTYNGNKVYTITQLAKGGMTADEITQVELGVNPNKIDYVDYTPPVEDPQTPKQSWSKGDIVAWLVAHGVTLSQTALARLSKGELLDLVADLLDDEDDD